MELYQLGFKIIADKDHMSVDEDSRKEFQYLS